VDGFQSKRKKEMNSKKVKVKANNVKEVRLERDTSSMDINSSEPNVNESEFDSASIEKLKEVILVAFFSIVCKSYI
jgi:hypothetical protein